ncbi:MAG TPA: NAD(P)-dependent alcohol dehydrogenase [Terriglobales bacterium]|nr:NAD(P)-dependent alcohol dehydrogenase [Terriglobales bacterium]
MCHSDLHTARNEWQNTTYPCVPGQEIVGQVVKAGSQVKGVREGDVAAVGCLVGSCGTCTSCKAGLEQYCEVGFVGTYNSPEPGTDCPTFGGCSNTIVVDEHFVFEIPRHLDLAATAPLLCAGITTYSPFRRWKVAKGQKVGVVGLGGLGHMALKFLNAFGAHAVLFTTSPGKAEDGKRLGADDVIITRDVLQLDKHVGTFDFILDTVSAQHDVNVYLNLLKRDGTLVQVGAPPQPLAVDVVGMIFKRLQLAGSLIGGIPETQEMLNFCGEHGIMSDIELIPLQAINEAYDRMLKSDVKYRFVIDMTSIA